MSEIQKNIEKTSLSTIDECITDLAAGKMVIMVDDETRENEGDLVCAAEKITPEIVNFMLKQARGVLCLALSAEYCDKLNLQPQEIGRASCRERV